MSWIEQAVLYQINLRALAAREPRNPIEALRESPLTESPLAYCTRHLEDLASTGVTVLHLMPPYPMGVEARKGIGSPYAARAYYDVDDEWGSLEEFDEWVRAAHRLGLKVIIGMVPNHTSRDHEWVSEHPEFYVRDEKGVPAYDLDWSDTAKLDYRNADLRQAMTDVYSFWLNRPEDAGVDGFRVDMAHFINDLSFWNQLFETLDSTLRNRDLLFMAECYGTTNNKDLFKRGFNAAYDDSFYKLGQSFYGTNPEGQSRLLPTDEAAWHNGDIRHLAEKRQQGGIREAVLQSIRDYDDLDPETPSPRVARYTDNHDEGRGCYRFGAEATHALMAVAFLSPSNLPFLLTGQEFGAVNRPSIHTRFGLCDKGVRIQDEHGISFREGVEFEGNLLARGMEARQQELQFYQELIRLRSAHPALTRGSFEPVDEGNEGASEPALLSFDRVADGDRLRCRINLGHQTITLTHRSAEEVGLGGVSLEHNRIPAFGWSVVRFGTT